MKPIKAKYPKRESELETTCERVTEKMENNPAFTNPPAALAELKKLLPEFRTARANAKGRDIEMVSLKNDKVIAILNLLQVLAEYVTITCKGDRTLILSSGFEATGDSSSTQPPLVEQLEVEAKLPGKATIRIKKTVRVKAYMHQYTAEPPGLNTIWVSEGSSQRNYTFKGLSSDKRYWFRVVAIGYNGETSYSPVVSMMIQ